MVKKISVILSVVLCLVQLAPFQLVSAAPGQSLPDQYAGTPQPPNPADPGDAVPFSDDEPRTPYNGIRISPENSTAQAPLQDIVASDIVSGYTFSCALTSAGGVKCWGDNWYGTLGNGTTENSLYPVDVYGLTSGVIAISSFHKHTCALLKTGEVRCWGYNRHGELGNGTTVDSAIPVTPVGLTSGVTGIAVGGFHTCALMNSSRVMCWGANWHGEIGDGTTDNRLSPVEVSDFYNVQYIAAGSYHTCALQYDGAVFCWGYARYGQLGQDNIEQNPKPMQVPGLTGVASRIFAGGLHTCVLLSDGRVKCWGDNSTGQLGNGTQTGSFTPVDVAYLTSGMSSLALGADYSCAVNQAGQVACWGDNWAGQLGIGNNTGALKPQIAGPFEAPVLKLAASDNHTCALLTGGRVKCWGSNAYGQLGDGISGIRLGPTPAAGLGQGETAAVAAGWEHACALSRAGGVKCWGNNVYGQLGDGTFNSQFTPVNVQGLNGGVVAIAAGGNHTCAIKSDSSLWCWGANGGGELGIGSYAGSSIPVMVASGVVKVAAGTWHTCFITTAGGIKCSGDNSAGQLGNNSRQQSLSPVDVVNLPGKMRALDAGEKHTCAIAMDGSAWCWGDNHYGQLGNDRNRYNTAPFRVAGTSAEAVDIATGANHSCIVTSNHTVECWGQNASGQLGLGTYEDQFHANEVPGFTDASAVTAGDFHTCVLRSTGAVECWGDNSGGQLGDGTTVSSPVPVYTRRVLQGAAQLSAGLYFTCGLEAPGPACWGLNSSGQIGDGSMPWETNPVYTLGLPGPKLTLNYPDGQPGSFFTLSGAYFPENSQATIAVNGRPFTSTLQTDATGSFTFLLDTAQADAGFYNVTVTDVVDAWARLRLAQDGAPLREKIGDGPVYTLSAGQAFGYQLFLPVSFRRLLFP